VSRSGGTLLVDVLAQDGDGRASHGPGETKCTERVQLRYSYRLYPTPGQQQALAGAFGCARVVLNDGLRRLSTI
jgi:hypothetical protein